jgi:hypothetical protein
MPYRRRVRIRANSDLGILGAAGSLGPGGVETDSTRCLRTSSPAGPPAFRMDWSGRRLGANSASAALSIIHIDDLMSRSRT